MTREQQKAISVALTRLRHAQERTAKVRVDNDRRIEDCLGLEAVARKALDEAQAAAGIEP